MIHLDRVAFEIKTVGLYDFILQDVQRIAGKTKLDENEIIKIIKTNPIILEEYKQLNIEYNLSNIHIKNIDLQDIPSQYKKDAIKINDNLDYLREIEKYTLDFEQSSTLVIIFSIEFFILFSVQYFIVLLNLKEWQIAIYTVFASSILFAYLYAQKEKKIYQKNNLIFEKLYKQTLEMLNELEKHNIINKEELIIKECEEHV